MALELKDGELANLLSLDGGGIKGISSLVIIKAIMDKVAELEGSPATPRKPVDYFHLAGGTSTGGIIALMLFRLRMTPQQAIDAYMKVGAYVFGTKVKNGPASFPAEPLLAAIDKIVEQYGDKSLKGDALLVDNNAKM
jgi:patatin-like phospholipase/acyl hydrolase